MRQSRRRFLYTAATGLTLSLSAGAVPFAMVAKSGKSRVARIVRKDLLPEPSPQGAQQVTAARIQPMVEEAVRAATGKGTIQEAWLSLVSPKDIIGIKVNTLAGPLLSTHPALPEAIALSLRQCGIPPGNIIVWDRLSRELQRAGYRLSMAEGEVKCFGSDSLPEPYEPTPDSIGSIGSCFATLVSRYCTALINVPILKDHDLSGVSLGMKNFYGAIHNPNKYHDNHCDPYIADLSTHRWIQDKLRLVIVDGLIGQYQGGPSLKPQWIFPFQGLLAGCDPVAVDRIGATLIESEREKNGLKTLEAEGRPPAFIASAAKKGLGTDQLDEIQIVEA
jgi:uncharacterized protein (DUF362 family)